MASNIIIRPVFNRPEMLKLSIDFEIEARGELISKGYQDKYLTLFLVEYGASKKALELVRHYPFPSQISFRKPDPRPRNRRPNLFSKPAGQHGLTKNILEGMKDAFNKTDEYVIILEDDIIVHKTYFFFISRILSEAFNGRFSCISSQNRGMHSRALMPYETSCKREANPSIIRHGHDYCPWAPLLKKTFFLEYVQQYANETYYNNRPDVICDLDHRYKHLIPSGYKYSEGMHNEQAGLINRLIDLAMIEKNMHVLTPEVDRSIHIGFYGANRGKGRIPGTTFKQRCHKLRNAIEKNTIENLNTSKRYRNYPSFAQTLETWTGEIMILPPDLTSRH